MITYNSIFDKDGLIITVFAASYNNPSIIFKTRKDAHSVSIQQIEKMKKIGKPCKYYRVDF